jgi:hypothetical protein
MNVSRLISLPDLKVAPDVKSHDYHVLITQMTIIGIQAKPEHAAVDSKHAALSSTIAQSTQPSTASTSPTSSTSAPELTTTINSSPYHAFIDLSPATIIDLKHAVAVVDLKPTVCLPSAPPPDCECL